MMKMLKSMAIRVGAAVVLCSVLACDSEPPTKPEVPKDYPVYVGDFETKWFWKYNIPDSVVDSFHLPVAMCGMPVLSTDGKSIYVGTWDSLVLKTDVASLSTSVIWQGDRKVWLAVSPDNNLLALCGGGLHIIRTSDFGVVFQDSVKSGRGWFSDDSRTFYACYDDPARMDDGILVLKLGSSPTVTRRVFDGISARVIAPSADENRLYVYFDINWDASEFAVFDVAADSFVFHQILRPGQGDMCRDPNDRYVFYTSPGPNIGIEGTAPQTCIYVYSTQTNEVVTLIDAAGRYGSDTTNYDVAVTYMKITPDNKWLVGTEWGFEGWLVVDVAQLQVVKREWLGTKQHYLGYLLCQTAG